MIGLGRWNEDGMGQRMDEDWGLNETNMNWTISILCEWIIAGWRIWSSFSIGHTPSRTPPGHPLTHTITTPSRSTTRTPSCKGFFHTLANPLQLASECPPGHSPAHFSQCSTSKHSLVQSLEDSPSTDIYATIYGHQLWMPPMDTDLWTSPHAPTCATHG